MALHRKLVRQGRIVQTMGKGKGEKTRCPSKGLVMSMGKHQGILGNQMIHSELFLKPVVEKMDWRQGDQFQS